MASLKSGALYKHACPPHMLQVRFKPLK